MHIITSFFLQKKNLCFFFLLFSCILYSQDVPIGGWKMHLPYISCRYVTGSSSSIWTATDNGLFKLNKSDYSVERITKIDGLSDLNVGAINYNAANDLLVVGYKNGNIDLVHGTTITNLNDIKRAQIIGDKAIHNIFFVGTLAYLSTGFGIVVIDTQRNEVKDTYYIGPNGTYVEVYDITTDGITLYAATEQGIYYAPINSPFLSNFATWQTFTNIPNATSAGHFPNLVFFNNHLIANYEPTYPVYTLDRGIIFTYDIAANNWDTLYDSINVRDLYVSADNKVYAASNYFTFAFDASLTSFSELFYSIDNFGPLFPRNIFVEQNGDTWEADEEYGLVKMITPTLGQSYYPNGPVSISAYAMTEENGELLTVTGGHDDAWNNVYNNEGVSLYNNSLWTDYTKKQVSAFDTISDLLACAIDPNDPNHYWLGSWGRGLVEMNGSSVAHVWDNSNSTLRSKSQYQWVGIGGLQYDDNNNLWVVNSYALTMLNVYKPDGTWQAFDFSGYIPDGETGSQMMITSKGQKWIILPRGEGMLVFDDNGTLTNTSDDRKIRLGFTAGSGGLPGSELYSMAEDDDGEIWVGTDQGVAVYYCAENIFTPGACDAQQILITQDGNVQILLETQVVTSIVVDGANRKWIGTEGGGVFLMSSDGQKELEHFTADNSPLLSDDITSMAIDKKTGELFIGTSKGIVSYRGEATEGGETNSDVYAFPNPVSPDYHGTIAITGLVKNADIKITDVSGQLIYKTTALGGQAIWDGNNFKGDRAASGVYLVYISNADGSQKAVTKILLIN
ncbi:MAG: T9SS type A sorting domain-containing protein [Bacteroidetes bacterium]|nr:T9SS type A sorting domain-containing protein [Bacteroidota bacterium]